MQKSPEHRAAAISTALVLSFLLFVGGCKERKENTPTSGTATILASESIATLIESEANEFHRIYPSVTLRVLPVATREAVVQFLNDSVLAIAIDRPLNEEEQYVVSSANLKVTENLIGSDAVVVLVPPLNSLRTLSLATLRSVLSGDINSWERIPESRYRGPIHLILTGRNSGLYEILTRQYAGESNPPRPSTVVATQDEIIRAVEQDRQAVGLVFFSQFDKYRKNTQGPLLRALNFELKDTTVQPTQETIYERLYPLSLPLYYYSRERKAQTASGFATFIKSLDGQKLIQNAGIVPATIPSRTIQITQEH